MNSNIENIGKRDVAWSYVAMGITIGAGLILLPFILHKMSSETVYIWNIFQTITYLVLMIDFGFQPSFSRSISFIFTGVKSFQKNGVEKVQSSEVDYAMLQDTIRVMKRLYRWLALGIFTLLLTAGTAYFFFLLSKYNGDRTDATIAWFMLIAINSFNLYTYYYDALLQGKGYVLRIQQITIAAQSAYVLTAIVLIECGLGLTAIVCAQLINLVIKRFFAHRVFYTADMQNRLAAFQGEKNTKREHEILTALAPNAIRSGLTGLGGFLVNRSSLFIGGAFISFEVMACYSITMQVLDILNRCSTVVYRSYTPKLAEARAHKDYFSLGQYYRYNVLSILILYVAGGIAWILLGNWALGIIGSQTQFLATNMLMLLLLISFLEVNHSTAAGFIQADNRIPFFIPSLLSGAGAITLLYLFLQFTSLGIWALIMAPGIAQLAYQNWRWPSMLIREIRKGKSEEIMQVECKSNVSQM